MLVYLYVAQHKGVDNGLQKKLEINDLFTMRKFQSRWHCIFW